MPTQPPSREQCAHALETVKRVGGHLAAARELKMPPSTLTSWLEIGDRLYGLKKPASTRTPDAKGRIEMEVRDGVLLIGSDAHYWPGPASTAHRAFVKFCKRFKKELVAVVMNGDATDLPRISRHPPPGWTRMPEVKDELEACAERLGEIAKAAGKARKLNPWGNHDQRFEVYLASRAAEVAGVFGTRLVDHFPDWEPCWSVFVNNRQGGLVIKHRYKGGVYAARNNALMSGRSMVTGHLHAQQILPHTDYNGTIWGVDAGCMADVYGPQFAYAEDNARSWRSGFALVTFKEGVLMPPELITVIEPGVVAFRGELIEV